LHYEGKDYVLSERNGKMVPEKSRLKAIQGMRSYEFTIVFDIDYKHFRYSIKRQD
jgi:hypothetical protein